jgi:hypothetical protein
MASRSQANGANREGLDFAGFAQEFLRRNPDYIRQYGDLAPIADNAKSAAEAEVMARNWGLCFSLFAGS